MDGGQWLDLGVYLLIYSFLGWCAEVLYYAAARRQFCNRGFLTLPFLLSYGMAASLMILTLPALAGRYGIQFLFTMAAVAVTESMADHLNRQLGPGVHWGGERPRALGGSLRGLIFSAAVAACCYIKDASGIRYSRNTPDMTAASSVTASNAGNYDLHLALHSNAAPPAQSGTVQGSITFYYPGSIEGQRAAQIIANNLKTIYPNPNLVTAQPTTSIGEVTKVRAPSAFLELAYHDNPADAAWIKNNLDAIARNLVLSLTEFFDIPFLEPVPSRTGVVDVSWGYLNIRSRPSADAPILAHAPDGAALTILNQDGNWYLVNYNGVIGYASQDFITLV